MTVSVVYRIEGIPDAIKNLRRRMARLENFRDPLVALANDFFNLQRGWMDSEGRGQWVELAPGYARWKRKKVGDKPILQLTGEMYQDLTQGNAGGVRVDRGRLTIRATRSGSRWKWHSQGLATGNRSGNPRPKRQVLSPALRLRTAHWNRLLARWAAGENV